MNSHFVVSCLSFKEARSIGQMPDADTEGKNRRNDDHADAEGQV